MMSVLKFHIATTEKSNIPNLLQRASAAGCKRTQEADMNVHS